MNGPRADPPKGAHGPPTGTVPAESARVGNGFVPDSHQLATRGPRRRRSRRAGRALRRLPRRGGCRLRRRRPRPRRGDALPASDRRARCERSPAARSSATASSRRSPAGHAPPARSGRSAHGTASCSSLPCHRVVGSDGIGGYGSAGVAVKRRLLALEGVRAVTSEDVREELARIAPERECDRLAELSALFHSAGSLHLRGKGEWGLHLDLSSGAAARRAFSLLRDAEIRSEIRTYRRRAFDRATRYQLHVEGTEDALRVLVAARACSTGVTGRSSGRRAASSRAPAAAAPTCEARSWEADRCPCSARRTSSCAPRRSSRRRSSATSQRPTT